MDEHGKNDGEKYFVDIDGVEKEWSKATISVSELRTLGGMPAGTQLVEINAEETESNLEEGAVVTLQRGHRYGKKVRWKRG